MRKFTAILLAFVLLVWFAPGRAGADGSGHIHIFGEWEELVPPKCASEGSDMRICAGCGEAEYRDTRISGDPYRILVSSPLPEGYYGGKTIVTLGDSVTCGAFLENMYSEAYPYVLGGLLGARISNRAISGTSICTDGPVTVNTSLTAEKTLNAIKTADTVTIMIGINDFNFAVKNGSWNGKADYYDESLSCYDLGDPGSTDTSTFRGALSSWCETITSLRQTEGYEDKKFVFITMPISSRNRSVTQAKDWDQDKLNVFGRTLREYCHAVMEVCAEYDIPVFDANMLCGIYYRGEDDNNVISTGGDGVHPSAEGHTLIASSLAEFLTEGYSYEYRTVADGGHAYENGVCRDCRMRVCGAHNYGEWVIFPPAAYGEAATETRFCYTCGFSETRIAEVPGDLDRNGRVDTEDALFLLRIALFPDLYSTPLATDTDGDGDTDTDDAVYLLRYSLFPGLYPLKSMTDGLACEP